MIRFVAQRPVLILAVMAVLAAIAAPIALQTDINTELIGLLPAGLPAVKAFREFDRTIGGHTFLTVLIESPDRTANERFGEALAARLARRDWAYQVHCRREVPFIERRWPFLLSACELYKLEDDFRESLSRAKTRHSPLAISLDDEPATPNWDQLRNFVNNGGRGQGSFRPYRTNPDGTLLIVQAQLKQLSSRVSVSRRILAEAQQDLDATSPASYHPKLHAELYGGLRYHVGDYDSVVQDVTRASLITLPLMLLVPALALRSKWEPLVVLVPMAIGMAFTYAGAQLVFGSLNLVTSFLFLILFGMGDDYPIHLLYRIREEMRRSDGPRQAVERGLRAVAAPLGFAAITDTAALFSLAWMQFRGFSHFGIIAGSGVCLILVATLLTVPGVVWLIRKRLRASQNNGSASPAPHEAAGPTAPRWRWVFAATAVAAVVAAAGSWLLTSKLHFEDDFDRLHTNYAFLDGMRAKVSTIDGYQRSAPAVFFTADFEASRVITRQIQQRLDQDGDNSAIGRVFSLASMVDSDTPERRATIRRILDMVDEPAFRRAPADIQDQVARLRGNLDFSPMTLDVIPASIRRSLTREVAGPGGGRTTLYLVVVEPRRRTALAPEAIAFADRLSGIEYRGKKVMAAGEALIFAEILRLIEQEGWVAMLVAWLAAAFVVFAAFRSWRDLAALACTVATAVLGTVGVLAALGMHINFFNITVFPLLIGLGINYGIHILHRFHEERGPATQSVRRQAAAVGSAAATTAVGFSGLLFAHHPGLWAMGFTATVGIGFTMLSCLLLLPALTDLLAWTGRPHGRSEEVDDVPVAR